MKRIILLAITSLLVIFISILFFYNNKTQKDRRVVSAVAVSAGCGKYLRNKDKKDYSDFLVKIHKYEKSNKDLSNLKEAIEGLTKPSLYPPISAFDLYINSDQYKGCVEDAKEKWMKCLTFDLNASKEEKGKVLVGCLQNNLENFISFSRIIK